MDNQQLAVARWVMVQCLAKEVWRDFPEEWHKGEMLEQLFSWYAARDFRFRRIGFQWSQSDGFIVYRRSGRTSEEKLAAWCGLEDDWYVGEAAIAAFLDLEVKGSGLRMLPTAGSLKTLYRRFESAADAVRWITRETARRQGMPVSLYEELDQDWPVIFGGEVREDLILEVPTIKEQFLGNSAYYLRNKD